MNPNRSPRSRLCVTFAMLAPLGFTPALSAGVFDDPASRFSAFGLAYADLRDDEENLSDSDPFPFQNVSPSHNDALGALVTLSASGAAMEANSFIVLSSTSTTVTYDLDLDAESIRGNFGDGPVTAGPGTAQAIAKLSTSFFIPQGFVGEWSFSDFSTFGEVPLRSIQLFPVGTRGPSEGYDFAFDDNSDPTDNTGILIPGEYIIQGEIRLELDYSNQANRSDAAGLAFSFTVNLIPGPSAAMPLALAGLMLTRRRRTPAPA